MKSNIFSMLGTFPFPLPPFLWNIFSRMNYRVNMKDYGQNFEYVKLCVLKKLENEKETRTCWRLSNGFSFCHFFLQPNPCRFIVWSNLCHRFKHRSSWTPAVPGVDDRTSRRTATSSCQLQLRFVILWPSHCNDSATRPTSPTRRKVSAWRRICQQR